MRNRCSLCSCHLGEEAGTWVDEDICKRSKIWGYSYETRRLEDHTIQERGLKHF